MAWLVLIISGLCEMGGVTFLNKYQHQNKKSTAGISLTFFALSLFLLHIALREIPMGIGYSVWTGIGAVGGALVGILFFNEGRSWQRISCIFIVLFAVIGLKLVS